MRTKQIENILFFVSDNKDLYDMPMGYVAFTMRKRQVVTKAVFEATLDRAIELENKLLELGSSKYVSLIFEAKQAVYRKRTDLERALNSIIHAPMELFLTSSLREAYFVVMCGYGTSNQTGRRLKPIVNTEKIRKVQQKMVDMLWNMIESN